MKKVLSLAGLALMTIATDGVADVPPHIQKAPTLRPVKPVGALPLVQQIPLGCSGATASDVVLRKHAIKNTTAFPIPKGTVIHWTASDKGTGTVTLASDLAPNSSVDVIQSGQTNGYTCTARFLPGDPDFVVRSVSWSSPTTASVEIQNANPWTEARESVALVRSLKCRSTPVASVQVQVPPIAKGASVTVTAQLSKETADYLEATANANNAVAETNKANNTRMSAEFAANKGCTPH